MKLIKVNLFDLSGKDFYYLLIYSKTNYKNVLPVDGWIYLDYTFDAQTYLDKNDIDYQIIKK